MPVVPAHHYQQTYSDADLNILFGAFGMPAELRSEVTSHLEDAAAIWRWYDSKVEARTPASESKAALRKLAEAITPLKAAFEALPPPAVWALEQQLLAAEEALLTEQEDLAGMPVLSVLSDDGTQTRFVADQDDYRHLIGALAAMTDAALTAQFGARRTKQDHALRMWISNIESLWTHTLGRPFTRDMTSDGTPISDAARFCVMAFHHVSPNTPAHSVLNAMKTRIKVVNPKSLANNTSESEV